MMPPAQALNRVRAHIAKLAADRGADLARLVAASKSRSGAEIRALAAAGQVAFGENYVDEALRKKSELSDLALEWHCIGALQSNKCRAVAEHFDWLQSLDREKLITPLARARPTDMAPLQILIQVNIDAETGKSGCDPDDVPRLAESIARHPSLALRGLMAIPAPHPTPRQRREGFAAMREAFERLKRGFPLADTLSMGMSEDFVLAIAEGATMVRIGSRLFGPRNSS